jgi:hypothetical protein
MVNCDETYPLGPHAVSVSRGLHSDDGSRYFESSTAPDTKAIVGFKKSVFEAAEEAAKEDQKTAEKIAKTIGSASQQLALRATSRPMSAGRWTVALLL